MEPGMNKTSYSFLLEFATWFVYCVMQDHHLLESSYSFQRFITLKMPRFLEEIKQFDPKMFIGLADA
jgi:hypothetical protein